MKKSCEGCRALGRDIHDEFECDLGYETKEEELLNIVVCLIPLKQCPKPRTYAKYCKLLEKKPTSHKIRYVK